MNIQKQSGNNDCGLFAVANSTLLSLGINPGKYLMNQGLMRSHLYECFIEGKMTIFPWIKERRDKEKFTNIRLRSIANAECRTHQLVTWWDAVNVNTGTMFTALQ